MSVDPVAVASRVLELIEVDDFVGILNIAAPNEAARVNSKSPVQQLRKYYLKLSLIIHPDRMGKAFPDATKAFQSLVRAFESLTMPELIEEVAQTKKKGEKGGKGSVAIARSNDGCYRTRVCCPRCKQPWNEGTLDGNPEYCYNFLMTGLKQYTCSTCLCEFGCMTAIHRCPFCKKQFEFMPSDFHNKVVCGNSKCNKPFGFKMYHASDRVIKDMKQSVKEEQERLLRAREAKLRRAKRSTGLDKQTAEASFLMGLSDVCPRCGEDFTESVDEEEQRRHLMECTSDVKHAAHQRKQQVTESAKAAREKRADAQVAAQTQAAWQFLGANNTQLWLLDEDQLRTQAAALQLDISGDKDDLISRIVAGGNSGSSGSAGAAYKKIGNGDGGKSSKKRAHCSAQEEESALVAVSSDAAAGGGKRRKGSRSSSALVEHRGGSNGDDAADTLPSNLHAYSAAQLRSMCAAQGRLGLVPKHAVKKDLIAVLEMDVFEIDDD